MYCLMNLKTLLETKKTLELCIQVYGATEDVLHQYNHFTAVLSASYAPLLGDQRIPQSVLNAEISPAVTVAFRPVYDVFKTYAKEFIGTELPPL